MGRREVSKRSSHGLRRSQSSVLESSVNTRREMFKGKSLQ